jgi:hypothetical protein
MLFMVIERFRPGRARDVYRRFRDRGRMAPPEVRYVSRGDVSCSRSRKVVAHAVSISTGGKPIVLVAEEDVRTF